MTVNLIAELVKIGIPARLVAKEVAKTLNVNEKTARNKINGITDFTLPEAITINETYFGGSQDVKYLFAKVASGATA